MQETFVAVIRTFRNSDTQQLAIAWQEHWQAAGVPVSITSSQLEQAILDKPFLRYEELIVAEDHGRLVGFAQMQVDTSSDPPQQARIASMCVGEVEDRPSVAAELVEAGLEFCRSRGIRQCDAGTVLGDLSGLVGVEPYAGVIGMLDADRLVIDHLLSAGFLPRTPMTALELNLETFREPLDRELLMLRRTASIEERCGRLPTEWRAACAHSHFDISKFIVLNRAGVEISSAIYYLSDSDALIMDRGLLVLAGFEGGEASEDDVDLGNAARYAVTGSLPQLKQRRFHSVRAIIDSRLSSADARTSFLEQIGFRPVASGAAYSLRL